ncbi:two-component regulator propeller domain-containing protein, partial [Pontibacter populi]
MKRKGWGKLIVTAIWLALVQFPVLGQSLHFNSTEVEYNNQPVKVSLLHQDWQGFIWLGTSYGLLRYTGTNYQLFSLPGDSATAQPVSAIYEDSEKQLWVGFNDGTLAKRQGQKLAPVIALQKYINTPITAILEAKDKTLWVSTYGQGVYYAKER